MVIESGSAGMSPETAAALLRFRFNNAAAARMNELAEKNRQGTIAPSERALLERYLRVGNFLSLIHAKVAALWQGPLPLPFHPRQDILGGAFRLDWPRAYRPN